MSSVRGLLEQAAARLEDAGVSFGHGTTNALDEAVWLLLHAFDLPYAQLDARLDTPAEPAQARAFRALVRKRISSRKPAAYLLKEAWLGEHKFYVDERVIVPRSFIAEWMQPKRWKDTRAWLGPLRRTEVKAVLDLCTGSGCLAILAALMFPAARVDAADISTDALAVARRNVEGYKLAHRVRLVESDLFSALGDARYDLIISNPPYVKSASMKKLPPEYRAEPVLALASGSDGLDHTRVILQSAAPRLEDGGSLVVEIGHNRRALERRIPYLPFAWPLTSAGAGFVFTLRKEDLAQRP